MNKKLIFLISALILLGLIVVVVFSLTNKKSSEDIFIDNNSEPEFLDEERKAYFGLAPETEAQILGDDEGYEIYKIIKND